jgi:hypothetical protein
MTSARQLGPLTHVETPATSLNGATCYNRHNFSYLSLSCLCDLLALEDVIMLKLFRACATGVRARSSPEPHVNKEW